MDLDIYKMYVLLSFFKCVLLLQFVIYNSNLTIASYVHLYLSVGLPLGSRAGPHCKTVFIVSPCINIF